VTERIMAEKFNVCALPRTFSDGNFKEWLQRFEICCIGNKWTNKAEKLATFLEAEALAVYPELDASDRANYEKTTKALSDNFHPDAEHFQMLDTFNKRTIMPNESPRMFLHLLKKLLRSSGIDESAHESLLFYRFISGLPAEISCQLRAMSDISTAVKALERTQLIMTAKTQTSMKEVASTSHDYRQESGSMCTSDVSVMQLFQQVARKSASSWACAPSTESTFLTLQILLSP